LAYPLGATIVPAHPNISFTAIDVTTAISNHPNNFAQPSPFADDFLPAGAENPF